jgi:dihydrofolate reductase
MAAYWPSMTPTDDPFAEFLNNCPKLVVSTTLQSVDWQNTTLITNDVSGEVARRKRQPGKDILIPGGATLVRYLVHEGLVDELRLLLFPIVFGSGERLFDGWTARLPLRLVERRRSTAGSSRSPTGQHPSEPGRPPLRQLSARGHPRRVASEQLTKVVRRSRMG